MEFGAESSPAARPRFIGYLEKRDRIFRVIGMSLCVGDTAAA